MSDSKISGLPAAAALTGAEIAAVVQAGNGVQTTLAAILLSASYAPPGAGAVPTTVAAKLAQMVNVFDSMTAAQQNDCALHIGSIDVTTAISTADTAATAAGRTLYFPDGTYAINMGPGIVRGGASWLGAGRNVSILKAMTASFTTAHYMVQIDNKANFTTSRLGFDISLPTFSSGAAGSSALLCVNDTNWETFDCAFTGIQAYTLGTFPNGGDQWSVKDNYFNMAVPSTNPNQAINVQNNSGRYQICRNICVGTGIFTQAGEGLFEGNIVTGWKFGSGITCDVVSGGTRGTNNRFIGNYCLNGAGSPDVNSTYSHGIENSSGNAIFIGNHCYNNAGAGIAIFGPNAIVTGNYCLNNNQGLSGLAGIVAYDIPQASGGNLGASGSLIANNILSDTQGSPTQKYGYLEQNITNGFGTGALHNMLVGPNVTTGNVTAPYLFVGTSPAGALFNGSIGLFGVTPPAQPTGYGTPTGNALIASFNASTITLPQLAAEVAQLVIDVKKYGVVTT